jgi:predicted Fe-Mo cluster-binding NifX family protein
MIARMNGRNRTESLDQSNARNATARTSTERHKTEATPEEAEEQDEAGDMDRTRIAIPCAGLANLNAPISPHFGRCDSYAIVTLEEGRIKAVESLSNANHSDCTSPVRTLAESGVGLMLVTGMRMRPYLAFKQLGIEVRY